MALILIRAASIGHTHSRTQKEKKGGDSDYDDDDDDDSDDQADEDDEDEEDKETKGKKTEICEDEVIKFRLD